MAAPAHHHNGADEEQLRKARRIQELFHSRFDENEALRLLQHCNWDVVEAANFALNEEPRVVREVCQADDDGWVVIRNDRVARDLAMRNRIPFQVRQFGCYPCDNMWWRRVPTRKMVSRCKRCRTRYEAVPKDSEWGWAKFICQNCGHEFHGFAQMNNTWCPCYNCDALTSPVEVLPPFRRPRSRRAHRHSCAAPNCYNRAVGVGVPRPNICVHPRSLRRRVVTPSLTHNSTGSTISTVLTQDDILSFAVFEPMEADISEEGSDDGDNPGVGVPRPNICVHPRSLRRRVVTPSLTHNSTGSTISTVLTQDDILSFAVFEPMEADISEEGSDDGDNPGGN